MTLEELKEILPLFKQKECSGIIENSSNVCQTLLSLQVTKPSHSCSKDQSQNVGALAHTCSESSRSHFSWVLLPRGSLECRCMDIIHS